MLARDNLFVLLCDFYQTDEIRNTILSLVSKPNMIYLPFATDMQYREEVSKKDFLQFYKNNGFVEYIGSNEPSDHHKRLIENANVIGFGSGDPLMMIDELGNSELLYRIKDKINTNERLVLMGQSAGAMYLCAHEKTHSYLTDDGRAVLFNRPCLDLMENIDVVPHCELYVDELIREKTDNPKKRIFGLTQGSALFLHNDEIQKIGNILVYEDEQVKEWNYARNPRQN